VVGRIRFALERWDSPRHRSHVARLFSLGHITHFMTRHLRRLMFVVLWTLAFVIVISLPVGFWLHRTLPAEARLAEVAGTASTATLIVFVAAMIGLMLGLFGRLPGTRKI